MPKSTLDADGQARLAKVMEFSEGKIENLPYAVGKALCGENERGRRVYLRGELTRRAKAKIHAENRKNGAGQKMLQYT